ncbi:hypothetical protein CVIRNUC_002320 [Coccomyxa viridis]|uniref:Uncharacterized protein n=1 Tax=Coccomyxa viridis TaxID=1274662 RepID=A0AAV1HVU5_9CHLO|nr:hypothetical protein CVIRNUC_002320 [Coccomyxa viridis]
MFCLSELFFTDDQAILKALQALAPFPSHVRHCLIVGPEYSGKTSALFHYAFNLASSGKNVYIVCQKAKLEQQPPLLSEGVSSSDAAFSRIHIRYLASSAELQRFAAFLHLLQDFPDAILIDGLCSFTADRSLQHNKRPTEAELVKMLALLHEAVNSARWVLRGRHHGHADTRAWAGASSEG